MNEGKGEVWVVKHDERFWLVVTMNKIFKLNVGNREFFGFYMDDKNVLFVREGLGCFLYQFYFRFGHFVKFPSVSFGL